MIRPTKQNKKYKVQGSRRRSGPARSDPNMKKYLNKKYKHKNPIPKIRSLDEQSTYIAPSTISLSNNFLIPFQVPTISSKTDAIFGKSIYVYVDRNLESSKLIEKTLNFEQVKPSEIPALFISKCRACCGFCNYRDDRFDTKLKQIKYETLHQLYNAITNQEFTKKLPTTCINTLFHMICINIFRPVNKKKNVFEYTPDCDVCDKEWPHLELIYMIFQYILSTKLLILNSIQIKNYVRQLFKLLLSPDEREQLEVCNALSIILKSFPDSRQIISAKTLSFLQSGLNDENIQKCFHSFLSFYAKNIQLLRPQKSQMFFKSFLLPLILSPRFSLFHESFLDVMKVTLLNDHDKANEYCLYLLNHWPVSNFKKQPAFLEILHQLVISYGNSINQKVSILLIKRLIECFSDPTADVSQQSMFMMEDDAFVNLFWEKASTLKNEVYAILRNVTSTHWIENTRSFAKETLDILIKSTPKEKLLEENSVIEAKTDNNDNNHASHVEMNWNIIKSMARKNSSKVINKPRSSNNENAQDNFIQPTFSVKPPSQTRRSGRFMRNFGTNST